MGVGAQLVSDEELVEQALASRTDAYAQLYARHRERVFRIVCRFARDKSEALDLCQEVFVKAFESLPTFERRARFTTWLTRIASNACVDHCRQAAVRRAAELDEESVTGDLRVPARAVSPSPTEALERQELGVAINAAIAKLSPEHRQVFLLHAVEGLTYEEIASVAGCPIGTVMSRLHYARKHLRGLLGPLGKDE